MSSECVSSALPVRAPGRVTIIGGHTGDNRGQVISAAIPLYTSVEVVRTSEPHTVVTSDAFPQSLMLLPGSDVAASWGRYVVGAIRAAMPREELGGKVVTIASNLPMQRGLASSAALVTATVLAANPALRCLTADALLSLCQAVEQQAGVNCGILDYYTNLFARAGHLMKIDCRERTHEQVDWPAELSLVVCDTDVPRELVNSPYNLRREQCQSVARAAGKASLREVTARCLASLGRRLPVEARRARHVLAENERVSRFADALSRREYGRLKELMADAHRSARVDYECSSPAQDRLVDAANAAAGCVGARLTGAGWGGATVNLVFKEQAAEFVESLRSGYGRETGNHLKCFVFAAPAGGALSSQAVPAL